MSVLDAVGSIARFCVKSVEEGFSEKADIIKDCQAEAKSGASGDTAANSSAEASSAITVNTNK